MEYSDEILAMLHGVLIDMLQKFDTVCKKYGITYWACFGTAIGAVRHHGFIPWDDDIDLGIMLEDYNRLRAIPTQEWNEVGLHFCCGGGDEEYHHMLFPRVYKNNTIMQSNWIANYAKDNENGQYNCPIWMDVFVFSRFSNLNKIHNYVNWAYTMRNLYRISKIKTKIRKEDPVSIRFGFMKRRILYYVLKFSPKTSEWLYKIFIRRVTAIDKLGGKYVTTLTGGVRSENERLVCLGKDMFPTQRVKFEETEIPIQKNCQEMLTALYGDYMKLPPENQRVNHAPAILDFGDGRGSILKSMLC